MPKLEECEIKGCQEPLGPGAAKIGYTKSSGAQTELKACEYHSRIVMMSEPGMWRITDDKELKAIPATRIII